MVWGHQESHEDVGKLTGLFQDVRGRWFLRFHVRWGWEHQQGQTKKSLMSPGFLESVWVLVFQCWRWFQEDTVFESAVCDFDIGYPLTAAIIRVRAPNGVQAETGESTCDQYRSSTDFYFETGPGLFRVQIWLFEPGQPRDDRWSCDDNRQDGIKSPRRNLDLFP